ncbi:MAG: 2-oxoglutarate dehydrogenase complex dihydrolipoyllysine-residue succinyltransferase [Acetobacter sp.]|jgi:2-oxoglutarate dehydrogenase E2 component (dihydrolipoamide succinyltransferase)|uniref:Dihydrolipoyllysine-residue succinyltransferase component of 2-oxoglutarate dehydrogenase complex n=1 Tax=Acetobacter lovaniensis TaxID=104100 RepID=A0A841QCP5_9PROT|nr:MULTISPECIES: 2-oxoglutarate dehydrogenase complex dihydrolipoyllysine-residue succinyltransferase [Acetobacter]MBB6455922.1 2-oxoglutarate dehydrogenase E2 component (dihydrolipoamide succinyltransferase) [Acetobacter lovaniensis]MCH4027076.1 2-oxoglutarate dehydrogenase complex dihydrolipoyllysine-residue succinyltransferase [Acetobacter fabarum]MCH4055913.1 2-oxoglutarate dehydrogenase complex dihydrolipoyllysine-residue succinyltransferase [Acetobacter fabarum]MCH4085062.1 2-oxoglutarate
MSVEIKVPTLGESVTTATIAKWLKQPGEAVKEDEPVVELETDKVSVEVAAPQAGVLGPQAVKEGDEVEVGALLATVEPGKAGAAPAAPKAVAAEKKVEAPATPAPAAQPAAGAVDSAAALPAARKIMAENGLSAGQVGQGTGLGGRITKGDVLGFLSQPQGAAPAAAPKAARKDDPREERVKMTRLRRTIARRLKEAQNTAAMLTTFNEIDMSGAMALRAEFQDSFVKKHGVKLGYMSIFSRAVIAALKEFPAINAEIDGEDVIYRDFINLGIAVGGPNGLVVPVIRDADKMGFAQIEKTISGFGKAAREGTLKLDELSGGTFSITNGGIYGSLLSTPILNSPQSGILGMHSIQERPVAVNGQVVIRPMMYVALSYDHRIVDGKEAVSFLVRLKQNVEDPRRLLIDV